MTRSRARGVLTCGAAALLALAAASVLAAQGVEYVRAHYTKYHYMIPMRDGVRLFTAVYVPKDDSQTYPMMLIRTPYGADAAIEDYRPNLGPSSLFGREGYIFVYQDVRGRNLSEGEFVNMRPHKPVKKGPADIDESTDTWDTIEWLVKKIPNNNGRVGMWGISYPGFYAAAGMIDAHPALKAVSPQAPLMDWFVGDDFHHNGALFLPHAFNFLASFGRPKAEPYTPRMPRFEHGTPDGYRFFLDMGPLSNANEKYFKNDVAYWNELMRHPNYDSYWQERNLRPHVKNIRPAVMTVGGWFDAEDLFGPLQLYRSNEQGSPGAYNTLVMGPWPHGGWGRGDGSSLGNVEFGDKTSIHYQEKIELPFFNHFLKDKGDPKLPEAYVFETGVNQWRRHATWPPKTVRSRALYLRAGGKLSFEPPKEDGTAAFDEYISDPARPVPFLDQISTQMVYEYMVADQRFASTRPDVLVYETDPLEEDVTVAGPVAPSLQVSTSGTDSDWVVKLIDVYPNDTPDPQPNPARVRMGGFQQLIRGEPMRGRFRNSFEKPEPFTPGKVTGVEFSMPDVYHTFRRGHKIMVQVQSTWFPLVDRNPQKFVDIYTARAEDFQKATQRVYRSRSASSLVRLSTLP